LGRGDLLACAKWMGGVLRSAGMPRPHERWHPNALGGTAHTPRKGMCYFTLGWPTNGATPGTERPPWTLQGMTMLWGLSRVATSSKTATPPSLLCRKLGRDAYDGDTHPPKKGSKLEHNRQRQLHHPSVPLLGWQSAGWVPAPSAMPLCDPTARTDIVAHIVGDDSRVARVILQAAHTS
jgi:hypothetical protein